MTGPPVTPPPRERWEWRRRIRADPHRYRVYRGVVGVGGVLLVLVGLALGPLPGPGGIPLVLTGLAVLASEFHWARRLLDHARVRLLGFTRWAGQQPRWLRAAGSLALLGCVAGAAYLALLVAGTPSLLPESVATVLHRIPGVED